MDGNKVTIERVMPGSDSTITLYKLSNGEIVNVDEAVNYVRQGKLTGVMVIRDEEGRHHIKPTGHVYNELK